DGPVELAEGVAVPRGRRRGAVRHGGGAAGGAGLLPHLPGAHGVPGPRARPPCRVRRLGRDDRARAPRPAPCAPGRHVVARPAHRRPPRLLRLRPAGRRRPGRAGPGAGDGRGARGLDL
ncbi:MAG: Transcriptional regulator, WhiB family, partial [uncultured Pseudonocardia sp.]